MNVTVTVTPSPRQPHPHPIIIPITIVTSLVLASRNRNHNRQHRQRTTNLPTGKASAIPYCGRVFTAVRTEAKSVNTHRRLAASAVAVYVDTCTLAYPYPRSMWTASAAGGWCMTCRLRDAGHFCRCPQNIVKGAKERFDQAVQVYTQRRSSQTCTFAAKIATRSRARKKPQRAKSACMAAWEGDDTTQAERRRNAVAPQVDLCVSLMPHHRQTITITVPFPIVTEQRDVWGAPRVWVHRERFNHRMR